MDLANRGWALRYLREARAELNLAREEPDLSLMFSFEAARKAQACIYHCLGSPNALEMLVLDVLMEGRAPRDRVMRLLLTVERMVQAISKMEEPQEAYRLARRVVELASKIVKRVFEGEGDEP